MRLVFAVIAVAAAALIWRQSGQNNNEPPDSHNQESIQPDNTKDSPLAIAPARDDLEVSPDATGDENTLDQTKYVEMELSRASLPQLDTARAEAHANPHTTPESYGQFARDLSEPVAMAVTNEDSAPSVFVYLENCVNDSRAPTPVRAFCLKQAERISVAHEGPWVKRYQNMIDGAPEQVRKLAQRIQRAERL